MRATYKAPRDEPRASFKRSFTAMERAATKAMRETAKTVQTQARAEIARGGLSKRWQTGFRARAKPRQGYSLKTSMRGYHRIGYANIFERGGVIRGKPLIWLPLPNAPQKIARKRITPKLYVQQIGPLHSINVPGKPPMLAGEVTAGGTSSGRLTAARLKTGARNRAARRAGGKGRRTVSVPIFVGIPQATIRDRLNVDRVYRVARERLPELYAEKMAVEKNR